MDQLLQHRERYAQGYVTQLQDGDLIPWKPLSVGDYLKYEKLIAENKYPSAFIENEIFRKCVLNPYLAEHLDDLQAGIISTVVQSIMTYSVPKTIQQVADLLNQKRIELGGMLHDLVCIVCQAFPAYKPDELYAMDSELFMERVALAERKLLSTGMLTEPLGLGIPEDKKSRRRKKVAPKEAKQPQVNLAHEYEVQQTGDAQTIITRQDSQETQEFAYTGQEKADRIVKEREMLQNTVPIYQEYMDQLQKDGKITIKSPEERKAAAMERARINELKFKEMMAKKKLEDEEATRLLAQHRQIKRPRRQHC